MSENLFNYMLEMDLDIEFEKPILQAKKIKRSFLYEDFARSGISDQTIDYYVQSGYLSETENYWILNYPCLNRNYKTDYYEMRLKDPKPGQGKYIKPKGQSSRFFRPLHLPVENIFNKSIPLMITEGSKKAIKAVQEGFCCISLSGVYNWKQNPENDDIVNKSSMDDNSELFNDIIPDLKNNDFENKTIILAYDSDMWHNPKVKTALYQLTAYLISEQNVVVKILKMPDGDAKGIDDFLLKYGKEKFEELVNNASVVSLKDIQSELTDKKQLAKFPISIFPKEIQKLIINIHKRYDAPIEYIACVFLCNISIIICGHYSINVKADSNWIEFPILWLILIGNPSQKKTPCLKFGKDILDNFDLYLNELYSREYLEYKYAMENYKRKIEDRKKKSKDGCDTKEIPQAPEEVHRARLTTQNITTESLYDIIKANNTYSLGVAIYIDELLFLLNSFNQYKKGGNDKQYFLQSWSKLKQNIVRKSHKIDYTVDVGHNIVGGIQPKVLYQTLLKDGIESTDGMIERWLYCCSDYLEKGFLFSNYEHCDLKETNIFQKLCEEIFYNIFSDYTVVKEYYLSEDAQKIFIDYYNKIIEKKKSSKVNDLVKSYLQKQTNYVARFSLIIHMFYDYKNPIISADIVRKAIKVSYYFINCFLNIINNKVDANPLEDLAISYLKTKNIKDISPTKLFKTNENKYKSTDRAKRVLENLAQKGYGRLIKAKNGVKFVFYS